MSTTVAADLEEVEVEVSRPHGVIKPPMMGPIDENTLAEELAEEEEEESELETLISNVGPSGRLPDLLT